MRWNTRHAVTAPSSSTRPLGVALFGAVALTLAAVPSEAQATAAVGDASYQIDTGSGAPVFTPGSFSGPGGFASITALPAVVLKASADQSPGASAFLSYYFVINGPDCGATCVIPVLITGSLSADSTPFQSRGLNAGAAASLRVDALDEAIADVHTLDGLISFADSWSGNLLVHTMVGRLNGVSLHAEAEGYLAHASADPMISIDPSFASVDPNYLTNYSITLSNGIGNALPAGAVPEPGTWAMLLTGFGLLGAALRGRRRREQGRVAAGLSLR